MFTTLVDGGQNAFQGILDGLKRLMIKIAAAIVAATILFFLTGGASAGGAIYVNNTTADTRYTIEAGTNGFSVGPITVDTWPGATSASKPGLPESSSIATAGQVRRPDSRMPRLSGRPSESIAAVGAVLGS